MQAPRRTHPGCLKPEVRTAVLLLQQRVVIVAGQAPGREAIVVEFLTSVEPHSVGEHVWDICVDVLQQAQRVGDMKHLCGFINIHVHIHATLYTIPHINATGAGFSHRVIVAKQHPFEACSPSNAHCYVGQEGRHGCSEVASFLPRMRSVGESAPHLVGCIWALKV